jgi:chloramphenicol-sensitive protein RarD
VSQSAAASGGSSRPALTAAVVSYSVWGVLPLFYQMMAALGAGSAEIVAWRTLWAVPFAGLLVVATGKTAAFREVLGRPRTLAALALSATLIGVNWLIYVWAVDHHRTLSASLGSYISPLMNMAAGALFFKERVHGRGWLAVALAAVGVVLQGVALGAPPWVSLALALTFCSYGIVRKQVAADAQTGLFVEYLILVIPAAACVAWLMAGGALRFGSGAAITGLLVLGGPVSVVPLATFAWAARRLPLTVMGFLQFILPTLQFAVGIATGEALTPLTIASFGFIWAGVAVFVWSAVRATRQLQPSAA